MAAAAGFLLASEWQFSWKNFLATLAGTTLIIASACVFNNYIDRGIDKKMTRTKRRAIASGDVSAVQALSYGVALSLFGFGILLLWTYWLVAAIGAIGLFFYVVVYGIAKRRTVHGTLVGTISGSMPLVAGYVAATKRLDMGAVLLVAIMTAWQMAHFYAIAVYRLEDYRAAGLPMLPVVKGVQRARVEIIGYTVLFAAAVAALTLYGYAGVIFALVMLPVSVYWLWGAFVSTNSNAAWGRNMFIISLLVLLILCVMLAVGSVLP